MWSISFSVFYFPFSSLCPNVCFASVKMLGLSFFFRLFISILILKLKYLDFLVVVIGENSVVLQHFCHLYQFLFLGSSKPWITAHLETMPGDRSLHAQTVFKAFHQHQSETGYWGKLYQTLPVYIFPVCLHVCWVLYSLEYITMFISLLCLSLCEWTISIPL